MNAQRPGSVPSPSFHSTPIRMMGGQWPQPFSLLWSHDESLHAFTSAYIVYEKEQFLSAPHPTFLPDRTDEPLPRFTKPNDPILTIPHAPLAARSIPVISDLGTAAPDLLSVGGCRPRRLVRPQRHFRIPAPSLSLLGHTPIPSPCHLPCRTTVI